MLVTLGVKMVINTIYYMAGMVHGEKEHSDIGYLSLLASFLNSLNDIAFF